MLLPVISLLVALFLNETELRDQDQQIIWSIQDFVTIIFIIWFLIYKREDDILLSFSKLDDIADIGTTFHKPRNKLIA
jgi:hypothetical protein